MNEYGIERMKDFFPPIFIAHFKHFLLFFSYCSLLFLPDVCVAHCRVCVCACVCVHVHLHFCVRMAAVAGVRGKGELG